MKIRIHSLLITLSFLSPLIASEPLLAPTLHEKVEEICARTAQLAGNGYNEATDILARQNTAQLLTPLASRIATAAEAETMVNSHLSTELYYAFNTEWGIGKVRNHRIVYDFLCQLDKATTLNAIQKEHLTVLTILSLAAQEYFWNEKSTVIDLRSCVRQELRYGLFQQAGHKLNVTSLIYLDDTNLNRLITLWIEDSLIGKLRTRMTGFRAKTLGATYTAIVDDLTTKLASVTKEKLDLDLSASVIAAFRLATDTDGKLDLKPVPSVGDGMCGEHSLFIPTDGALAGIQEGNGRYKILRAIFDNANTSEVRRLYLLASQHMDGPNFEALIERQITALRLTSAIHAEELQAKLDAYREKNQKAATDITDFIVASKKTLVATVAALPGLGASLKTFNTALNDPAQLTACSADRIFRNIIDELIKLRGINAELDRLLSTIDADILRLDGEIAAEKSAAQARFPKDHAAALEIYNKAQSDFEAFQKDNKNAALLHRALELIAAHGIVKTKLATLAAIPTTPAPILQAAQEAVTAAVEEFNKFKTANLQFFKDHEEKEMVYKVALAETKTGINYAARDAKIAEKYRLIGDTLKGFIGTSMLPGASANAFTVDALSDRYGSFINDLCPGLCTITANQETQAAIQAHWDTFQNTKMVMEAEKERQATLRRVEMATSLPIVPAELSPESLRTEMVTLASRPEELSGWLPCDALYTQLWASLNNLNIFVFSSIEEYGKSPLNIMTRIKDSPYENEALPYPASTTGKHLATVILTSPTARNVFLNKSPSHYDKFITPDDLAAIARELRHVNWSRLGADCYKLYPAPDPITGVPLASNKALPTVTTATQ